MMILLLSRMRYLRQIFNAIYPFLIIFCIACSDSNHIFNIGISVVAIPVQVAL